MNELPSKDIVNATSVDILSLSYMQLVVFNF